MIFFLFLISHFNSLHRHWLQQ